MPAEWVVARVQRDDILTLRDRVLAAPGGAAIAGDLGLARRHWAAWAADEVVGCVSVMRVRGYALRGMAVSPDHQRLGVGTALLRAVCAEVDAAMWCNARLASVPFYAHAGWTLAGPTFEMQEIGEVALVDLAHVFDGFRLSHVEHRQLDVSKPAVRVVAQGCDRALHSRG